MARYVTSLEDMLGTFGRSVLLERIKRLPLEIERCTLCASKLTHVTTKRLFWQAFMYHVQVSLG